MKRENTVVLITGGASRFGEAFCHRFAEQGAQVALVDLERSKGERVVAAITERGGQALCLRADVARRDDVTRAFDTVEEQRVRSSCWSTMTVLPRHG